MRKTLLFTIAALVLTLSAAAEDKLGNALYRSSANATEAVIFSGDWIKGFTNYRIAVSTHGTVTSGQLDIQISGGVGGFRTLEKSIDLAAPQIMIIDGPADAIRFRPGGFDGTAYTVEVLGWR